MAMAYAFKYITSVAVTFVTCCNTSVEFCSGLITNGGPLCVNSGVHASSQSRESSGQNVVPRVYVRKTCASVHERKTADSSTGTENNQTEPQTIDAIHCQNSIHAGSAEGGHGNFAQLLPLRMSRRCIRLCGMFCWLVVIVRITDSTKKSWWSRRRRKTTSPEPARKTVPQSPHTPVHKPSESPPEFPLTLPFSGTTQHRGESPPEFSPGSSPGHFQQYGARIRGKTLPHAALTVEKETILVVGAATSSGEGTFSTLERMMGHCHRGRSGVQSSAHTGAMG